MAELEKEIKTTFTCEKRKLMLNVVYTANWIKNLRADNFVKFGISHQQYNILRILRGGHPAQLSMQDIKSRMLEKSPNTTRLTDKLFLRALIERIRCDKDRRVVYVGITNKGLEMMNEIDNLSEPLVEKFLNGLDEKKAKMANELLDSWRDEI
ncbi:MAG: MarR family transcriptional regulator [Flavobacteriales bacterium]|nr:MarR family transcriptional regulator [Flavobacteriales bacterium]